MITFGILISNIINYGVRSIEESDASWVGLSTITARTISNKTQRIVIGLGIFFSLPLGLGILIVPESPRWLGSQGKWEDARISFARLRGLKDDPQNPLVEDDINEMRVILEKERQVGTGSWLECFSPNTDVPKVLYRTLLGIAVHFLQQWTGVNYFFYYGATIFTSAGVDDPILVQLILGAVNVATTFYGLYVVEKYGLCPLCCWVYLDANIAKDVAGPCSWEPFGNRPGLSSSHLSELPGIQRSTAHPVSS